MNCNSVKPQESCKLFIMAPNRIDFVPCQVHPISSRPVGSSASSARPTPYPAARNAVRRSLFAKPERGEIDSFLATETQRQKDKFFEKYTVLDVRPQGSEVIAAANVEKHEKYEKHEKHEKHEKKEMPSLIAKELQQYEEQRSKSKIYQLEAKITQIENTKLNVKTKQLNIVSSDCSSLRSANAPCDDSSAAAAKVTERRDGTTSGGDAHNRYKQKRITEFLPKCKSIPPP